MTSNDNVNMSCSGNRLLPKPPVPPTTRPKSGNAFAIDTDDVKFIPATNSLPQTRIDDENDLYSELVTVQGEYEDPVTAVSLRRAETQKQKKEKPRGGRRSKTNEVYSSSYDEEDLLHNNPRFSGYSVYSYASNTDEVTEHTKGSYYNPVAEEKGDSGRRRENTIYCNGSTGCSNYTLTLEGIRRIGKPCGVSRLKKRRTKCVPWFACVLSFFALVLAGWAFYRTTRTTVLDSSKTPQEMKAPNAVGDNDKQRGDKPGTEQKALTQLKDQINFMKKNTSKLMKKSQEMESKTSKALESLSELQSNYAALRKKVDENNLQFKRSNQTIWSKIINLRGPRGYNGSDGIPGQQGPPGPQGKQGPRGPTVKGCWRGNTTVTNNRTTFFVTKKNTTSEVYFDISCQTSLKDGELHQKASENEVKCECDNKEVKKVTFSCTMIYVRCTFLNVK